MKGWIDVLCLLLFWMGCCLFYFNLVLYWLFCVTWCGCLLVGVISLLICFGFLICVWYLFALIVDYFRIWLFDLDVFVLLFEWVWGLCCYFDLLFVWVNCFVFRLCFDIVFDLIGVLFYIVCFGLFCCLGFAFWFKCYCDSGDYVVCRCCLFWFRLFTLLIVVLAVCYFAFHCCLLIIVFVLCDCLQLVWN